MFGRKLAVVVLFAFILAAPALGAGFQPNDIFDMTLWLDAADASTITIADGGVSSWRDKSDPTGTRAAVQGTADRRPTYDAETKALVFNGSVLNSPQAINSVDSGFTVFVVGAFAAGSGANSGWAYGAIQTPDGNIGSSIYFVGIGSSQYHLAARGNTSGGTGVIASKDKRALLTLSYWPEGNRQRGYVYGENKVDNNAGTRNPGSNQNTIGDRQGAVYRNIDGTINEIIIYQRQLTLEEQQQVEGYLAAKWEMLGELPEGHLGLGTVVTGFTLADAYSQSTDYMTQPVASVSIDAFSLDDVDIVSWMITEDDTEPDAETADWKSWVNEPPTDYTIQNPPTAPPIARKTLWAWVLDSNDEVAGTSAEILYSGDYPDFDAPTITATSSSSAEVFWTTFYKEGELEWNVETFAKLQYKEKALSPEHTIALDWTENASISHTFEITGLTPNTTYEIELFGNQASSLIYDYDHLADAPAIVQSPVVEVEYIAANVLWTTDADGAGRVRWGLANDDMPNMTEYGDFGTSHSRTFAGLQPDTEYFYSVQTSGSDWSIPASFTTPAVNYFNDFNTDLAGLDLLGWTEYTLNSGNNFISQVDNQLRTTVRESPGWRGGTLAHSVKWFDISDGKSATFLVDAVRSRRHVHSMPSGAWVGMLGTNGKGLVFSCFPAGSGSYAGAGPAPWRLFWVQDLNELVQTNDGNLRLQGPAVDPTRELWTGTANLQPRHSGSDWYDYPQTIKVTIDQTHVRIVTYDREDFLNPVEDTGLIAHGVSDLDVLQLGAGTFCSRGPWTEYDNMIALGSMFAPPTVTDFQIVGKTTESPEITLTHDVDVTAFAGDVDSNAAIVGYMITESPTRPSHDDNNWWLTPIQEYEIKGQQGYVTLYAWVLDTDDIVSPATKTATIFYQTDLPQIVAGPTVTVTDISATITWETNIETISRVVWGDTNSYGYITPWSVESSTTHERTITIPFSPGTTYHYALKSGGTTSNDFTFTSPEAGGDIALTLYVDAATTVSEEDQDGTEAAPFDTIGKALSAIGDVNEDAGNEVRILVAEGTYEEHIDLAWYAHADREETRMVLDGKWLRIKATGEVGMTTIVQPSDRRSNMVPRTIIERFTITQPGGTSWTATSLSVSDYNQFIDCRFSGTNPSNWHMMSWAHPRTAVRIAGCTFTGNNAILINGQTDNFVFEDNVFDTSRVVEPGPHTSSGFENIWFRRNIVRNRHGIEVNRFLANVHIYGNVFQSNNAVNASNTSEVTFYNNTLINSRIENLPDNPKVFNNILISGTRHRWGGEEIQPPATPTLDAAHNLIAASLQDVAGNRGLFVTTDFSDPDYAKINRMYMGTPSAAYNGLADFEGVPAIVKDLYGIETTISEVSIGATMPADPHKWLLIGDANLDCAVNILDLIFVRNRIGQAVDDAPENWQADLNEDGDINVLDLMIVRENLNTTCPQN